MPRHEFVQKILMSPGKDSNARERMDYANKLVSSQLISLFFFSESQFGRKQTNESKSNQLSSLRAHIAQRILA
jgi:hypothetical protein